MPQEATTARWSVTRVCSDPLTHAREPETLIYATAICGGLYAGIRGVSCNAWQGLSYGRVNTACQVSNACLPATGILVLQYRYDTLHASHVGLKRPQA